MGHGVEFATCGVPSLGLTRLPLWGVRSRTALFVRGVGCATHGLALSATCAGVFWLSDAHRSACRLLLLRLWRLQFDRSEPGMLCPLVG